MRILHAPTNIGGMAFTLAKAQRELGNTALSYIMIPSLFDYEADIQLDVRNNRRDLVRAVWDSLKFACEFDVFHFYFGKSLTGYWLYDVPVLRLLGRKVFFYFCGSDIRDPKRLLAKYPFLKDNDRDTLVSSNRDRALATATKYADGIFVSTPDLLEFVPQATWLPQPIDLDSFDKLVGSYSVGKEREVITIAHAPSSRSIKGSDFLIRAVQDLKQEGYSLELSLIENLPYEKALKEYVKADIVVDQLLIGWYGQVAVEMMALRKPVICYLREDLLNCCQEKVPIVNANSENVKEALRHLIENRDRWDEIGAQGRLYVEQVHDAKKVARTALKVYEGAT